MTKASEVDLTKYVNVETGEELLAEVKGKSISIKEKTGYVTVHTEDYIIVNAEVMDYLKKYLNRSEIGSLHLMSEDLKTPFNIIYNNNVPHTNETLQCHLGIASNSTFNLLIRKLIKIGVLYQIKGNIMGDVRVIYMLNPFIARKRKSMDEDVMKVFKELKL